MTSHKKSRAEMMAVTYGEKLAELDKNNKAKYIQKLVDTTTPEMEGKLKKAKEKLRTFLEG